MEFGRFFQRKQESNLLRAQDRTMTISEVAKGYDRAVTELMASPYAPAIRNEVKKFLSEISPEEAEEQGANLEKLVKALEPYKSFFKDIWEDETEREPFALALVEYEKSLQ